MSNFSFQQLTSKESAGEILIAARKKQEKSLAEIAKVLHIRKEHLQALEDEEYNLLPSGLYGRQFLREYCQYLKIKIKDILPLTPFAKDDEQANPFSQKILRKSKFLVFPKLIRNFFFILLFCVCLLYLLIYFRHLVSPPNLVLEYPDKNLVINESNIIVKGQSEPETEIRINSTSIMSARDGSFIQEVKLKQGLNNISVSAKKKYGQESVIQRQILVENNYESSQ